jgi:fumarate reductase flavoprotein subunit
MLENAKADRRIAEYHRQGLTQVSWLPDDFREKIAEGVVKSADSLAELAGKLGMDPKALETSVARYNKFCETGVDEDFGKEAIDLTPILKPPFAAVEVRNLLLWLTHGGLQVNADAQVLNEDNMPISGLYAAGEVVNNINGATYFGTGFSISSSLTLGRIAGAAAAAFATASQEA